MLVNHNYGKGKAVKQNVEWISDDFTVRYGGNASAGFTNDIAKYMTHISLPENCTSIGDYSFRVCTALKSIFIPKSVTQIGKQAFAQLSNLADIYYAGSPDEWNSITKGSYWNSNMGSNVTGGTTIHYNCTP